MQLRCNFRLYPTLVQVQALARAFGCARVVYNDALCARRKAHDAGLPYISDAELSARLTSTVQECSLLYTVGWIGEAACSLYGSGAADLGNQMAYSIRVWPARCSSRLASAPPLSRSGRP